jgi:signal transduction histidine kinase
MKSKNSNKRLVILMIFSQILLTGFMVRWLASQYKQERSRLNDELAQYYIESHDAMVDTVLFKSVVSPVLSHADLANGKIIPGGRQLKRPGTTWAFGIKEDSTTIRKAGKTIITVRMNTGSDSILHRRNLPMAKTSRNDFLMRSVKLFIGNTKDSTGAFNNLVDSIPLLIDTAIFRSNYMHHLSPAKKKFHITWDFSTESKKGDNNGALFIKPIPVNYLPEAIIKGYNGYLLGAIFPQVLFGLVLVIITAISFFAAYRNIRNHVILNEIRNEFISNMTHELKTPVSTMKIALESLLNFNMKNDPAVTEEYLNLVSIETKRLESLINRVLEHTFLEGSNHPFSFHEINAVAMIEGVVKIMVLKLGQKGSIRFVAEQPDIHLTGDELYIQGVLMNLIDNSIKYCDKDPEIMIGAGVKKGYVEIRVTDNGPGIPEKYRNKVFDKFFRIPTGDVHNIKGYGLGLSYAALVMKMHGGGIDFINHNPGCTFVLRFPV